MDLCNHGGTTLQQSLDIGTCFYGLWAKTTNGLIQSAVTFNGCYVCGILALIPVMVAELPHLHV